MTGCLSFFIQQIEKLIYFFCCLVDSALILLSSTMSTPFQSPTPAASANDWAGLVSNEASVSSPSASAAFVPQTNLGGTASSGGVVHGESVIVLLDSLSSADLCCAPIGTSGRSVCFRSACDCSVVSHAKARKSGVATAFAPGIYVRSTGTDAAYLAPVGDIALLANHRHAILNTAQPEVSAWPVLFNDWARSADSTDVETYRLNINAMKAIQTPAPRKTAPPSDYTALALSLPSEIDLDDGLALYEKVWTASAISESLPLPASFTVGEVLLNTATSVEHLNETVLKVASDVASDRAWSDSNAQSSFQRVTDLELSLGRPATNWSYGETVWSSLSGIAAAVETLSAVSVNSRAAVANVESEFNAMFQSVSAFKNLVGTKLSSLASQVDLAESQSLSAMSLPEIERLVSSVELMSSKVSQMEKDRLRDRIEIKALQTRLESGTARFELSSGVVLRGPRDVRCYLERIGATTVGFGGFADVYNILARADMMIAASPSFAQAVKSQKDVSGTNMSQDEALVNYSFMSNVPGIFSGKKTDKTSIPSLTSAAKWKSEQIINAGMGYELEEHVETARNEVEEVISLLYEDFDKLQSLSNLIVNKASDFVLQFVRWVDETTSTLTNAGNAPVDVWALITKVMRSVFEEGLAPHRITPTSSKFKDPLEQTSVMIWGVIRTHIATKAMLKRGFKDHPVVVGAYAQWLVSNSGKKDASEAKAAILKLSTTVSDLRDNFATKKAMSSLESRLETVKKVADKAVAAARS